MSTQPTSRLSSVKVSTFEVETWFAKHRTPMPSKESLEGLAFNMNRMLGFEKPSREYDSQERPDLTNDHRNWWDFQSTSTSAAILLKSMPQMIEHWERLRWAPETAPGHEAVVALSIALEKAMPFIEWPFGEYKRVVGAKSSKAWHTYAMALYPVVGRIIVNAGQKLPAIISRNSTLVDVVFQALARLNIPDGNMMTRSSLAAYLNRWANKYGMTTNHITSLCGRDETGPHIKR